MFLCRYTFWPRAQLVRAFIDEVLQFYLGALILNGQILSGHHIIRDGTSVAVYCLCPEQDSLDARYNNPLVGERLASLVEVSVAQPDAITLGIVADLRPPCQCGDPRSYVVFTGSATIEPPVLCGDCGEYVPLYKLPHYGEETDYYTLLTWESTYKACHTLDTNSGVGSRFGSSQCCGASSRLNQDGLDICRDFTRKTLKPMYYYLCGSRGRFCRLCGSEWKYLEAPLAKRFFAVCQACGFATD